MSPIIEIRRVGNLGNTMIQYLAAWKLRAAWPGSVIARGWLPEWGLDEPLADPDGATSTLEVPAHTALPFSALVGIARSGRYDRIVLADSMQRMDCLPDRAAANALFVTQLDHVRIGDDELLINVRAEELVLGISNYPLVPADYYEIIIKTSQLRPVFLGQLGPNAYCETLRSRFPHARFIASQGAMQDFQTVRSARNIVIPVSTFS
jgi:hypothetical protein